jgi:hypothetical protein
MSYQKFNLVTELKKLEAGKSTKMDFRTLAGLAALKLRK